MTPARHYLYHNRGDGTLRGRDGVGRRSPPRWPGTGRAWPPTSISTAGSTCIVANDMCPKFLFLNRGDGTFEDSPSSRARRFPRPGDRQASMGVDAEDSTATACPSCSSRNFENEYNTLYRNLGGRSFQDVSASAGIVKDELPYVGWGCGLADFDNDGLPDMFVVNGHVDDNLAPARPPDPPGRARAWSGATTGKGQLRSRPRPRAILRDASRRRGARLRRPGQRRRHRRRHQPYGQRPGGALERVDDGPLDPPGTGRPALEPLGDRRPASRSASAAGCCTARSRGAAATSRPTIPGSWSALVQPIRSTRLRSAGPPERDRSWRALRWAATTGSSSRRGTALVGEARANEDRSPEDVGADGDDRIDRRAELGDLAPLS